MRTVNLKCAIYKVALAHLKWRYDTYEGRDFRNDPFNMSSFDFLFAKEKDLDTAFKNHKKEALSILFQDDIISDQLIAQAHICEPCEVSVYRLVLSTYIRCKFDLAATRGQLFGASSRFYNKYMGSTVREKYYTGPSDRQSIEHLSARHPANFTRHPFYNFFEAITSFRNKPEVKTIHPTIW